MSRRPVRAMMVLPVLCLISGVGWIVAQQLFLSGSLFAAVMPSAIDLTRHEKQVREFEAADKESPPPQGAILFTGSSSVRQWHKHLSQDFQGFTVLGRGFGGSTMPELLNYIDRLVLPYEPRAVVVYEGDNDLNSGRTVDQVVSDYRDFHKRLKRKLPNCHLFVLAIKPSPAREKVWSRALEANDRLAAWCQSKKGLTFIDVATPMLDEAGKPRPELFVKDRLHMNRDGYKIWQETIRPYLTKFENARTLADH
jgi:lysophospholipase L1-like esterase